MSQRDPMFAGHMAVCCFAGFLMFDIDLLTGIDNTIDNICTWYLIAKNISDN